MNYFNLHKYSHTINRHKHDSRTIVAMPMMTDNLRFYVKKLDCGSFDIKMYYNYPIDAEFPPKDSDHRRFEAGGAFMTPVELLTSRNVHFGHEQASQYYVVSGIEVYKKAQRLGLGPALYDKCIEIATNEGRKLMNAQNSYALRRGLSLDDPAVLGTSDAAKKVWQRYQTRNDVTKHVLPTGGFALSKPTKFFYEK